MIWDRNWKRKVIQWLKLSTSKKWKNLKKNVYNVVNDVFHVFNFCMVFRQCGGQKLKKRWFLKKKKEKKGGIVLKNG